MGRAEKEWAKRKRQELMALLGNVCAHCATDENLEFDCISPMGHRHHRGDASQRMCFYRRQFRQGNLQVLCGVCNARKGDDKPVLVLTAPWADEDGGRRTEDGRILTEGNEGNEGWKVMNADEQ